MRNLVAALAIVAAFLGSRGARAQDAPVVPPAPQPILEGHNVRVPSGSSVAVVDLGCEGRASLRVESKVFVACGPDGVVEIDLSNPQAPRRAGRVAVDGDATGLFLRDGRVWVEIAHVDARPMPAGTTAAAPVDTTAAPSPSVAAPSPGGPAPSTSSWAPHSMLAPPRRGGLWEVSATVGAFVNLGPVGGGAFGWASAVYRFDAPIVVRAEFAPFAAAVGQSSTNTFNRFNVASSQNPTGVVAIGAGHVLVGLDTQFVEVAVGGGAASISHSDTGSGSPAVAGPSIVEEGRFGARDGLALNVESITVAANNQFLFGSFILGVQVPVTPTVMLLVRGGGGNVGLLFGDLGARVLVRGDGGPDTVALTGFFGGAGIDFQSCSTIGNPSTGSICQNTSMGGPSIGGGVEWRH